MIEYITENTPQPKRLNVAGIDIKESPNYAGKLRENSGFVCGAWNTRIYIGDRLVSDSSRYIQL